MTSAAEELQAAFQGQRVRPPAAAPAVALVACVGPGIPVEVIRASGFRPKWIFASPSAKTPEADAYLESGYGPEVRSIFEQLVTGAADDAVLVVLDRAFRDVFYYLKELVRLGLAPTLPPLHMVDLVLAHDVDTGSYNEVQVERLAATLRRLGGDPCTDERLREQIRLTNSRAHEARLLQAHRRRGAISGVGAFRALAAARSLEPGEHRELLADLNRELADVPDRVRARVLVWSGEAFFHDELHSAVESLDAQVVGESDAWPAAACAAIDDSGAPLDAVRGHHQNTSAGPELRPFAARAARFAAALDETSPDVVLFYVPPNDAQFGWDYPALRATAEAAGVRTVLVRDDVLADHGQRTVVARLRAALDQPGRVAAGLHEGGSA